MRLGLGAISTFSWMLGHVSPWFPAGLVADLEEILGCEVDVVTERGLREEIREIILEEARPL